MSDKLPIAEIFHSIQGEGHWTGTPMMFVRLAGCNVGKYHTEGDPPIEAPTVSFTELKLLDQKKHSICTTFDGQRFLCDTDYHPTAHLTPTEIVSQLRQEKHVCITGGEPALHDLEHLVDKLASLDILTHIETSGTIPFKSDLSFCWITCCPKDSGDHQMAIPVMDWASEWKFLVGPGFSEEKMLILLDAIFDDDEDMMDGYIYLQPINGVEHVWEENLARCLQLLEKYPWMKLSAQLHKYIKVR